MVDMKSFRLIQDDGSSVESASQEDASADVINDDTANENVDDSTDNEEIGASAIDTTKLSSQVSSS